MDELKRKQEHGSKLDNQAEIEGLKILEKTIKVNTSRKKQNMRRFNQKGKAKNELRPIMKRERKNMKLKSRIEMKFKKNSTARNYSTILGNKKCGLNAKMRKIKQ